MSYLLSPKGGRERKSEADVCISFHSNLRAFREHLRLLSLEGLRVANVYFLRKLRHAWRTDSASLLLFSLLVLHHLTFDACFMRRQCQELRSAFNPRHFTAQI